MDHSAPNSIADTNEFEFAALNEARNYRQALICEFAQYLKGDLIEIGAGIGQISSHLRELKTISRLLAIEPDPEFCKQHRINFPGHELVEGIIDHVEPGSSWDAILSINVLEHIEEDASELAKYAALLKKRSGALCLFVPARPEIYAPIDRDFGHFRRYTKPQLRAKLTEAGFRVERLEYFNLVGYLAWWLNFCVLKKRLFELNKVRFYDRVIFPLVHRFESKVVRPPLGQSLLAVAVADPVVGL